MSVQNDSGSLIKSIMGREAFLLAVLTGLSYYFSFSYQKAYLSYFGFSSVFVDVSIGVVLSSATGALGLIVSIYSLTAWVPNKTIQPILRNFFFLLLPIGISLVSIFLFYFTGFSWPFVIVGGFTALVNSWWVISLRQKLKSGILYNDLIAKDIESEMEVREQLLGPSLLDGALDKLGVIPYFILIAALFGGAPIGSFAASKRADFLSVEIDGANYAIVQSYRDGLLMASYEMDANVPNRKILTGQTMYIGLSETSKMQLQQLESVSLEKEAQTQSERVSFSEFIQRIKNLF